jgi:hypothetical protein
LHLNSSILFPFSSHEALQGDFKEKLGDILFSHEGIFIPSFLIFGFIDCSWLCSAFLEYGTIHFKHLEFIDNDIYFEASQKDDYF